MRDCFPIAGGPSEKASNTETMLSATQEIPLETLKRSPATIGRVTEPTLDLPCIVPVESPIGPISQLACWSRAIVSIGVSLLGHAGVLAWLGYASGVFLPRLIPVQEGHASIELTATIASTSQPTSLDDPTDVVQIESADPLPTRPSERPVPTLSALSMLIQRTENSEPPPIPNATVPHAELPCSSVLDASRRRIVPEQLPPQASTSNPDEDPTLARTRTKRIPTVEVSAEPVEQTASTASQSSPASQAADGADSLPAVVHNPAPQYPSDALQARRTGRVVLRVTIASDGSVTEARVHRSSGVRSLDQAALEAVRKWRFEPSGSVSAPVRYAAVPIRFEIVEPGGGVE